MLGVWGLHVLLIMCLNIESLMVGIRDTHAVSWQIEGFVQSRSFARSTAHSIHTCTRQVAPFPNAVRCSSKEVHLGFYKNAPAGC